MTEHQLRIIASCRKDISAIDREIFSLIKKREQLSAAIGEAKRGLAIPDRDFSREKAVFDNAIAMAKALDLPISFVIALQKLIIQNSLSRQERDRIEESNEQDSLSVLVIGGSGRMGGWLARFFVDSGHRVSIYDLKDPGAPYTFIKEIDESVDQHDLIVVATPIRVSIAILQKLSCMAIKKPVIFDVSSVKAPVHQALLALKSRGIMVTSLHPMFGPSVQLLFGKHVIITSLGIPEADEMARNLFKATSLQVIMMSMEQHDRTMAYLLSLCHLTNIVFGTTLNKSQIHIKELEAIASPTFSSMVHMARKVFDENPHLYYEIQTLNPHNHQAYKEIKESLSTVLGAITTNDEREFVALMQQGQSYLC